MTTSTELVESELLPAVIDEPPSAPITLFGTSDPQVALEKMSEVATVLVDVIKDRKLFARICGHEHITAEGWTTLGGMLGVVPVVCWTKPNETGDGYVARVEARTLDGRVVGAAESECSRAERRWKTADPYAIRSDGPDAGDRQGAAGAAGPDRRARRLRARRRRGDAGRSTRSRARHRGGRARDPIPDAIKPTADQLAELNRLLAELEALDPGIDWPARAREIAGVPATC